MLTKGSQSLKEHESNEKSELRPRTSATLTSKKNKAQKNEATREIDREFALRLIRDHLSTQTANKV